MSAKKPSPKTSKHAADIISKTLQGLADQDLQAPVPEDSANPPRSVLESRENDIRQARRREMDRVTRFRTDPARCRMWSQHNRRYELLDEIRCQDLIEGFRAMGQQFPAIVREVSDDPNFDWEVVCGARRHWTASYLGLPFYIEPRDLSDEEAFRLSDIENRDRQDISDYERAMDYQKALETYYENNQSRMVQRLETSNSWLSRFLDVAHLPNEIVKAYRSVTEIRVNHMRVLKPLLEQPESRKRVIEKALELQNNPQEGRVVVRLLKAAANPAPAQKTPIKRVYAKTSEKPMLGIEKKSSGVVIEIFNGSGASKEEILAAISKSLDDHL